MGRVYAPINRQATVVAPFMGRVVVAQSLRKQTLIEGEINVRKAKKEGLRFKSETSKK